MLQFGLPVQVEDVKATDDGWTVSGYGSTFGNVDLGNDVVMPGAFKRSLQAGGKVRFLHSHDPRMVLGVAKSLREDDKGLFGEFKISKTKLGEDTRQLLKDGAMDSFSIGFITKEYEWTEKGEVRQLKDVDLLEVSLVSIPMNPQAMVTNIKSYLLSLGIDLDEPETVQAEKVKVEDADPVTLAQKARQLSGAFNTFISEARVLVDSIDRPLTHKKRTELEGLLGLCSGLEAVRSDLEHVLATAPSTRLVDAKRVKLELESHRRRLAHILKEN
jgi:hypothetical protein